MFGRLVVKLLFKACVPLVAVAGVMSYGVYLRGGDPAALWKHVASGAFGQVGATLSKAKSDVAGIAGDLAGTTGLAEGDSRSGMTQVFTWKDARGVTHFGTTAPDDVTASTLTVDPNTNVLVPVTAEVFAERGDVSRSDVDSSRQPVPTSSVRQSQGGGTARSTWNSKQAAEQIESETGMQLPGIAGQILSNGGSGDNGTDPAQLIRLLQSVGK